MKTKIFVGKTFGANQTNGVEVGIVGGLNNNSHSFEYQVFDLKQPVENVGLIGVDDKDEFAISLKANFTDRFAIAVYLDGVNVSQLNGIKTINEIEESKRDRYYSHQGKFICESKNKSLIYLFRYNQISGENRRFTFTTGSKRGINEVLVSDPSLDSRIEIYLWVESPSITLSSGSDDVLFSPKEADELPKTKVGAGEATNAKYESSNGLIHPSYLGKVMFIHLNSGNLKHLGGTKVYGRNAENFNFKDPMDLVPRS